MNDSGNRPSRKELAALLGTAIPLAYSGRGFLVDRWSLLVPSSSPISWVWLSSCQETWMECGDCSNTSRPSLASDNCCCHPPCCRCERHGVGERSELCLT